MPNISTLAVLICQGKSSQNACRFEIPRMNFPERPFLAFLCSLIGNPEFPGISLERAFGVPKSHFRGKMKLVCWAAVSNRALRPQKSREIKGRFRKRVVLANVPSLRFFVPGDHENVPSFRFSFGGTSAKTTLFENHSFANPRKHLF